MPTGAMHSIGAGWSAFSHIPPAQAGECFRLLHHRMLAGIYLFSSWPSSCHLFLWFNRARPGQEKLQDQRFLVGHEGFELSGFCGKQPGIDHGFALLKQAPFKSFSAFPLAGNRNNKHNRGQTTFSSRRTRVVGCPFSRISEPSIKTVSFDSLADHIV
ncbi:MAG: hypothetical protein AB1593_10920 [Pseudomonadota bacterium]